MDFAFRYSHSSIYVLLILVNVLRAIIFCHCLHTSLAFHKDISSKYENIIIIISTGKANTLLGASRAPTAHRSVNHKSRCEKKMATTYCILFNGSTNVLQSVKWQHQRIAFC
uniref:Uncharacterized protein n=1 Tax=Glossina pallidipes TaxID=7398 RepID=A0A1A9ZDG3_GLOPL